MSGAGMMMGTRFPPLVVTVSPASVSGSSTSSTVTSGAATLTVQGGSGLFDVAWTRQPGGNSLINSVSPAALSTAFRATGMSVGSISATFKGEVVDRITGEVQSRTVNVYLERGYPELNVSTPSNIDGVQVSSTEVVVSGSTSISISGGVPPYNVTWSGSGDFSVSGGGTSCSVSKSLAPGGGVMGSLGAYVTDSIGQGVSVGCSVMLRNMGVAPAPLGISASPTSVSGFGNDGSAATESVSFSVTGGVGPFSINVSGGPGSVTSPNGSGRSHSTNFTMTGIPWSSNVGASFAATVTDHGTGQTASVGVSAIFYNFGTGGGGPIN